MELETMKSLWQAHDEEIKKMSRLNDNLLTQIIRDKSTNALEKIKNTEYLLGSLTLIFLAILLLMINQLGGRPEMVISYAVTIGAFTITLAWGAYKLFYLSRIDISAGAVADTAEKAQRFQLLIIRERLVSILSLFIVAPAAYILVFQWVRHESAFDFLRFSITEIAVALVLGITFTLVLYRRVYFKNLKNIIANLKEIDDFKKEIKTLFVIAFLFLSGAAITKTSAATGVFLLSNIHNEKMSASPALPYTNHFCCTETYMQADKISHCFTSCEEILPEMTVVNTRDSINPMANSISVENRN